MNHEKNKIETNTNKQTNYTESENVKIDLKEVDNRISQEVERYYEKSKADIDKLIQSDKASLMTIFGLFASILTFLTIEFQFLTKVTCFYNILGFTLVLFALLISFNLALDYLAKNSSDKIILPNKWFMIFILLTLVSGVVFIWLGQCSDNEINKIQIGYDKKISELETKILILESKK